MINPNTKSSNNGTPSAVTQGILGGRLGIPNLSSAGSFITQSTTKLPQSIPTGTKSQGHMISAATPAPSVVKKTATNNMSFSPPQPIVKTSGMLKLPGNALNAASTATKNVVTVDPAKTKKSQEMSDQLRVFYQQQSGKPTSKHTDIGNNTEVTITLISEPKKTTSKKK